MWPLKKKQTSRGREIKSANEALRRGDYSAAAESYKALLADDPDNVGLLLNLGTTFHLAGQHTPAIARFERVLELEPRNATALINLAAAHGVLGHLDKAIEILARVLEIEPSKRDLHYNLAALYARKGLLPNAMAELELELALHADHVLARTTLAELRRQYLG